MSVLIKDMEKPKYCYVVIDGELEYCPFVNTDDDCVILLKKGISDGTWEEQYSKCPLAEEQEIIRCKDCKHWIPYDWMFSESYQSQNIDDYPVDEIGCRYCDMNMRADDYCSRAERKEECTP